MTTLKLIEKKQTEGYEIEVYESEYYQLRLETKLNRGCKIVRMSHLSGEYMPTIYVFNDDADNNFEIKIQTSSYGSLELDDIQKVINGYEIAVAHINEIKEILKN